MHKICTTAYTLWGINSAGGDRKSGCGHILSHLYDWGTITNILFNNCPKHSLHPHQTSSALKHCPHGKDMEKRWARAQGDSHTGRWQKWLAQRSPKHGRVRTHQHTRTLFLIPALTFFAVPFLAFTYHRQNNLKATRKEIHKQKCRISLF